jgi:putative membrane protein
MIDMAILYPLLGFAASRLAMAADRAGTDAKAMNVPNDQDFLSKSAVGNLFAIESSRLACSKARKAAVRRFAENMVSDHSEAAAKFKRAVADAGLSLPPEKLDHRHRAIVDELSGKDGAAFDTAYVHAQFVAHVEAVELFRTYGQEGGNVRMKQFARELLPTLMAHLEHVSRLR